MKTELILTLRNDSVRCDFDDITVKNASNFEKGLRLHLNKSYCRVKVTTFDMEKPKKIHTIEIILYVHEADERCSGKLRYKIDPDTVQRIRKEAYESTIDFIKKVLKAQEQKELSEI